TGARAIILRNSFGSWYGDSASIILRAKRHSTAGLSDMQLAPGSHLGSYQILTPLGAGGMGEVYQARDLKLGREVAIKGLKKELAQEADRLARFEREARLLASLNHPNIAAIYGLDEAEGVPFLVLELVPGPTLGERLKLGALSLEESCRLAGQIAEALEAAH